MCNNLAFQCLNLTQEQCTTVALTVGITDLVLFIVSTFTLLCLLLVLKRKAWNSPVKRLTLIIITYICFWKFVDGLVELYDDNLQRVWHKVFKVFIFYTLFAILFCMITLLAILLLQIGAAIVPGEWKNKIKLKVPLLEVVMHILIILLSAAFSVLVIVFLNEDQECNPQKAIYVLLVLVIVGLSVILILLVYLCGKYSKTHGITRRAKWLLVEFSVLFILLLTKLVLDFSTYQIHEYYTLVIFQELRTFLDLVIILTLIILVYLPDVHCHNNNCCKCFKRAPDQRPLLVNSGTQHTNPASVWNHANDPSSTVYNPPPEMSDCVTDATRTL